MNPNSAHVEYSTGAACPLESTNLSFPGFAGSCTSKFITEKNRQAMISAADIELVGCPLPAAVVARIESILN